MPAGFNYTISGIVKENDNITPIAGEVVIALYPNPVTVVGVAQTDALGAYSMTLFGPGDLPLMIVDTGCDSYTDEGFVALPIPVRDARIIGYALAIATPIEI